MKILCLTVLTLFALTLAGGFLSPAKAQALGRGRGCSVDSVVTNNVNWLKQPLKSGGTNIVNVTAVSNQANRLASYAVGELKITAAPFPSGAGKPFPTGPYTLGGNLTQYFSDRTYGLPNAGMGLSLTQYPFAAQKTDQLGLEMTNTSGTVTFTLNSWGGTKINLNDIRCVQGVLLGYTYGDIESIYVISLTREFRPNGPDIK